MEAIRALRVARSSAVKARSHTTNQIKSLLITAPVELREQLRSLTTTKLIATCARLRPTGDIADPATAICATRAPLPVRPPQQQTAAADHSAPTIHPSERTRR